jgi:hypothetical protein
MVFKNKIVNKFWRFSSSFYLGIPVMVCIAILIAYGTIVESRYDAYAAKKIVYNSWMMWTALSLLVYNLTIVVLDRWPWQPKHYPFMTVHAGMIILVFGGYVTYKFGLDGQMSVKINAKNNMVSVSQTDLVVYATFDGDRYSKIVDREVDFFNHPPNEAAPFLVNLGDDKIEILQFIKYARLQNKVKTTENKKAGASIRFQLMNANVKQVEQITQPKKDKTVAFNLGPAQVHLGEIPKTETKNNEIFLAPLDEQKLKYTIFYKDAKRPKNSGTIKIGDVISTGWMGLELRLLDYLPRAQEEYEVLTSERPTPLTTSAIKIKHKDVEKWLALNDMVKLFGNQSAYLMSYQNRRIDLGFDLKLNKFEVERYQGTSRAKEYASQVEVVNNSNALSLQQTISMNEPLKFMGYTIYQASFQEDEQTGEPIASVFSINQDPGRPIVYGGSLVFSLGIIWLFYQRRKRKTSE